MTETEKQERIEQHRKYILNEAENIVDALEISDVDEIYYSAQYIVSEYGRLQSLERVEVDEEN